MTANTNFDLRWELNDGITAFASGKAESGVFDEGGFKWKAGFHANSVDPNTIDFTIACDHEGNRHWRCEANVDFHIECHNYFIYGDNEMCHTTFAFGNRVYTIPSFLHRDAFASDNLANIDPKFFFVFRIDILSFKIPPIIDVSKFCSPNEYSNVTLIIGDNKLRVSKEYLAHHSPVMAAMFFGNFAEKGKEEVELKDIDYEDFLDLMNLIFLGTTDITDDTVLHILMLSDRFQMKCVLEHSEKYLMQSNGFDVMKKLLIADRYRLDSLKEHCFQSFNGVTELVRKMQSFPEFANFSDAMKVALCERIAVLNIE